MNAGLICTRCQGSGIAHDKATAQPGVLMPLCDGCRGWGQLGDPGPNPPYRAAFLVGSRFIVRITIERRKGGYVEVDVDWSPHMPEKTGKRRLRPSERKDYEAGRTAALQQHMAQMGGGDWSLVEAGERH